MNSSPFISQTKLNVLTERVCRPIQFLATEIASNIPLWDGPIEMCQKIEDDPFTVDSIIQEVRKLNRNFAKINSPSYYNAILCRVYILLYYRHRNEEPYQEIVYPRLYKYMGEYHKIHQKAINEQIDKIREQEDFLKQSKEKKNITPVFAYVPHSRIELDHMYIEYCEEELFCNMRNIIRGLSDKYGAKLDEANVWYNAKKVVHTLRDTRKPELLIRRAATALVGGQIYKGYNGSQLILLCAYAMVRSSKNNEHFKNFMETMESIANADTDMSVIKSCIYSIGKYLDKSPTSDGYDYIGEQHQQDEKYTEADIEKLMSEYTEKFDAMEKQLEEKDQKISELENTIKDFDEAEEVEDTGESKDSKGGKDLLYNHVCYELFLRLLEKAGCTIGHSNKTVIGELGHKVTGKSSNDIRKYCSNRKYKNSHTTKQIEKLNTMLETIGITEIRL